MDRWVKLKHDSVTTRVIGFIAARWRLISTDANQFSNPTWGASILQEGAITSTTRHKHREFKVNSISFMFPSTSSSSWVSCMHYLNADIPHPLCSLDSHILYYNSFPAKTTFHSQRDWKTALSALLSTRMLHIIAVRVLICFVVALCMALAYGSTHFYRDPGSVFFDRSRAYGRFYSQYREQQAKNYVNQLANTQNKTQTAKAGDSPKICATFLTAKREGEQVIEVHSKCRSISPQGMLIGFRAVLEVHSRVWHQ